MKLDTHRTAHRIIAKAVECGHLTRPHRCESCNTIAYIEAHHDDYNKPMEVTWLCRSCHNKLNPNAFEPVAPTAKDFQKISRSFKKMRSEYVVPDGTKSSLPRRWKRGVLDPSCLMEPGTLSFEVRSKERTALIKRLEDAGFLLMD